MPTSFHTLSPALLTRLAARALDLPDPRVTAWALDPIGHTAVIETTGGLFRLRGEAEAGGESRSFSTVLKIVRRPDDESDLPGGLSYWRRETLAYQSGLLADLPPGLRAPRLFHAEETPGADWLWLEDIPDPKPAAWDLEQYFQAARGLGRWGGAYLAGQPVPDQPWLCRGLFAEMYADGGWWARFINPSSANNAWQRPLVQAVFPGPLRERVLRIWAEKQRLLQANTRLPRVLCHNDAHRANLVLLPSPGPTAAMGVIALDWGFCGPGGLGNDLAELVGGSLAYFTRGVSAAVELEAHVLEGCRAGLQDAGIPDADIQGAAQSARLGYLISLTLYWGGTLACEVAQAQPSAAAPEIDSKYGRPLSEHLPGWIHLAEFALDRAEEAFHLI